MSQLQQRPPVQPLLPSNEDALRRLTLYIQQACSGIAVVEVNSPAFRDELMGRLTDFCRTRQLNCRSLSLELGDITFFGQIERTASGFSQPLVLNVVNWEGMLEGKSGEERENYLRGLNFGREVLSRETLGEVVTVFWVPTFLRVLMAQYAPDLYDWRGIFIRFEEEPSITPAKETARAAAQEPGAGKVAKETITLLEQQLRQAEEKELPANDLLSQYLLPLAELHERDYSWDKALSLYQRSLALQQEVGDRAGEGATLNNISQIYDVRGDYETALSYLEKSLKIRREVGDRVGEGATLNNISQIYHARGDYETALSYLEKSLKIRREVGDRAGEGRTLNNISQIYDARGDYETAISYLEKSLKIRREVGDRVGEGATLNNISLIYKARGDYETAISYLEKSLKIRREVGDRAGEVATLHNMALIYLQRNDVQKAQETFSQALGIATEIGYAMGIFHTSRSLGQLLLDTGKKAEGLKLLRQAYNIGQKLGVPDLDKLETLINSPGSR